MRTENVKVTMEIPVHFNEPDKNGHVYTKESWEKAIKNAVNTPIEIIHDDGTRTMIRVAQDVRLIQKDDETIIFASGTLMYGGTFEEVKYTKDIITSVTLNSIGITK